MITHEMLVGAIYGDDHFEACDYVCIGNFPCEECLDRMVTEYENSLRADERKKVLDEVISVLVDLGYGDEENGAEWAYMVALYDVARRIKQMKEGEKV